MADREFKKSPTAFLANRFALNKQIQPLSKKRIEKEIEYLESNDETATTKSAFIEINKHLNKEVDGNKAVLDGSCPAWNPNRFKSGAKLRVMTPGFRENSAKFEDAFYTSDARNQGTLSATCGIAPHFIKTLKGETLQLDQATFLKVNCGTVPTMYAHINGTPVTHKFLTATTFEYGSTVVWTDGTTTYYTENPYSSQRNCTIYSNSTCTTPVGYVHSLFVYEPQDAAFLAGMLRSIELDTTIGQTNYYGWFYFGYDTYAEFTQVYTTKEKPVANDPIFFLNADTGAMVQFPATFKVVDWSAPATMFDVDYEFDWGTIISEEDAPLKSVDSNDIKGDVIHIKPANTHFHYNLRALIHDYYFAYKGNSITVTDWEETPTVLGTFNFDEIYNNREYTRWKNTDTTAQLQYVYTYTRRIHSKDGVYSDSELETNIGYVSALVYDATPVEYLGYMAYAAPQGDYTDPEYLELPMAPDYTSTDRREMKLEEYQGIDITPYITEKWWATANVGYGEVSSQTTLYTETVYRYKDLDAHLNQYLPATWQGNAYGCIIVADSSTKSKGGELFFGVSHSDHFTDGSDVYYIIPTNTVGTSGENGPYDLVHAYVYDAALNSIYSSIFAIDSTSGNTTVTHHYISDATGNYQVNGQWRYHYACIEDKNQDIYAKRLSYSFSDLYYLVNGVEVALNPETQTLVTPQLFPYGTLFSDYNNNLNNACAWYDFVHTSIQKVNGFKYTGTVEGATHTFRAERIDKYDTQKESTLMYSWDVFDETAEHYTGYVYTDTLTPVANTTKIWTYAEKTWTEGATITTVDTAAENWYRFHTSIKETYLDSSQEPHERFKVIWAGSRNPNDYPRVYESNYSLDNPAEPTTPDFGSSISYDTSWQCYIAPAYQMVITYKGEDFTYTADYNVNNPLFRGILYSGWYNADAPMSLLFTARITPRVGDLLYYVEADGTHVATDFTIKQVKSVVDFIYSGRR